MKHTVQVDNVSKRYGQLEAVRGVSFALPPGETVALVGHNGAGKTTLMKLMLGLIHPSRGSIQILGENPAAGEFAARRRLGYLPENVSFNAGLTGRELLSFYARLKGDSPERALQLLDRVGLAAAASRRVGTYSKGMRQRLGLAQALIGEPALLLLDEPTTGLDPALRQSFYEIVQELRDRGATVILSSHALTELEERTDRVIIMNRGLMVANGSLDALRRIARLPTRIRLRLTEGRPARMPDWLDHDGAWRPINGHVVEFDASPERKMEFLRQVMQGGPALDDIEVVPPTLDELYAHFLRSQEDAR
ncbi:ABC transporter ATP-binding protein [uncultured Ferrovibrio sp.]|jgi:Cu-processing system ATP-binding protein|uniref:ABC transporter ATP-binding protein n=1 Tax=uncultured Ferrovibrio sp. TaxID=1576913 RepID=UPI002633594B|nr:ABC transporter ATP-binding protein [uncultured Ferrovibrio sp.]